MTTLQTPGIVFRLLTCVSREGQQPVYEIIRSSQQLTEIVEEIFKNIMLGDCLSQNQTFIGISGRILDKAIQLVSCERTHLIFAHDLFARLLVSAALTSKKEIHCCELCVTSCQLGCSGGMSRQGWGDDYDINLPINSSSCGY